MFRTELPLVPATDQLPATARVLTLGSCFADSIGLRLAANKVDTLVNPFGTVFQPLALGRLLRAAAGEEVDWQQHLVEARGRWQSYDLHGSIGADSPVELLQLIQGLVRGTGEFLRRADMAVLTLGTAWAYRLRQTGELVSNCHKQSADLFVRELLTPDDIINGLAETHAYLRRVNPSLRFVLTVSPVRHLKDTLPLNAVSKSVLRVATHFLSDLLPDVAYFPAYELLLDELRDYRFYAADMLHPSEVAEDYIWEKFARTYFDAEFGRFRKEWAAVRQSLGHRPLHPGAPEYRQFLESTLEKLEQLSLRKVGVAAELHEVRTRLAALPVPRPPKPVEVFEDDEERVDIGEDPATAGEHAPAFASRSVAQAALPLPSEGRPPRLSPEEFRAQRAARLGEPERGRRDGRGNGRQEFPADNEPAQTPATVAGDQLTAPGSATIAPLSATTADLNTPPARPADTLAAAGLEDVVAGEAPVKKKKRRSRGGAKRTARKNALRLAAGELLPTTDSTLESADTVEAASLNSTSEVVVSAIISESRDPQPADDLAIDPAARPVDEALAVNAEAVLVRWTGWHSEMVRISQPEAAAVATAPAEAPPADEAALPALATSATSVAVATRAAVEDTPAPTLDALLPNLSEKQDQLESNAVAAEAAIPATTDSPATDLAPPLMEPVESGVRAAADDAEHPNTAVEQPTAVSEEAPQAAEAFADTPIIGTNQSISALAAEAVVPDQFLPALEAPTTDPTTAAEASPTTPEARLAPARRSGRAKPRAISGGRAEKPAVDTPVIPVPDALLVRTQVAAGRLTGSVATLIEPTVPPKKAPAPRKTAAPKKAATPSSKAPKAAPAATSDSLAPEATLPAIKPKPTAKPRTTTPKPATAAKPKATASDATAPKPAPAAKPKVTAPKPRAPKKPAQPD